MRPEGHLATAIAASAAAYATTASASLATGVLCGAFWIDLDHYADYVLVERQYSLNPLRFARYYLDLRPKRLVLALHSYELMVCLAFAALLTGWAPLIGYVLGAALHLGLDIRYNVALQDPLRFYSFFHRWRRGFRSTELLGPPPISDGLDRRGAVAPGPAFPATVDFQRPGVRNA